MTELYERSVVYALRSVCLIYMKFLLFSHEIRAYIRALIYLPYGVRLFSMLMRHVQ